MSKSTEEHVYKKKKEMFKKLQNAVMKESTKSKIDREVKKL